MVTVITEVFWIKHRSGGFRISQTEEEGANPWVWAENLLFDKIFAENCMKINKIGPRRRP